MRVHLSVLFLEIWDPFNARVCEFLLPFHSNFNVSLIMTHTVSTLTCFQIKCSRYWPREGSWEIYDDIEVSHVKERHLQDVIIRKLTAARVAN